MGAPANLTRLEQELLAAKAEPAYASSMLEVADDRVRVPLNLHVNEFAFIEGLSAHVKNENSGG
jgi:hypothetical protein